MDQKLQKLYNTLLLIETKGESTKIMSQCLGYLEQLIKEVMDEQAKANTQNEA